MRIGYIGSPDNEERELWKKQLKEDCKKVYIEKLPMASRTQLGRAMEELMPGDTFVVGTLADLGVNAAEILERCFAITSKNVSIEAYDNDVVGQSVNDIYAYIKKVLQARQKPVGKQGPKKAKYTLQQTITMYLSGVSAKDISEKLSVPLSTVYRTISEYKNGKYQEYL